jgi:hypothetical protein
MRWDLYESARGSNLERRAARVRGRAIICIERSHQRFSRMAARLIYGHCQGQSAQESVIGPNIRALARNVRVRALALDSAHYAAETHRRKVARPPHFMRAEALACAVA